MNTPRDTVISNNEMIIPSDGKDEDTWGVECIGVEQKHSAQTLNLQTNETRKTNRKKSDVNSSATDHHVYSNVRQISSSGQVLLDQHEDTGNSECGQQRCSSTMEKFWDVSFSFSRESIDSSCSSASSIDSTMDVTLEESVAMTKRNSASTGLKARILQSNGSRRRGSRIQKEGTETTMSEVLPSAPGPVPTPATGSTKRRRSYLRNIPSAIARFRLQRSRTTSYRGR